MHVESSYIIDTHIQGVSEQSELHHHVHQSFPVEIEEEKLSN